MDMDKLIKEASTKDLLALLAKAAREIEFRQGAREMPGVQTFTDGASRGNPGPGGAGVLIFDGEGKKIMETCLYLGKCTNNEAEYRALILALEKAAELTRGAVSCFMDSELMARQLNGVYQLKSEKLKVFFDQVQSLTGAFRSVSFTHVRREHPKLRLADKLANKAIDDQK